MNNPQIGTVSEVLPDGTARVELNESGRTLLGPFVELVIIPAADDQADAPIVVDGGKDADSYKLNPGGHRA